MAHKTKTTSEFFDGGQLFDSEAHWAKSILHNVLGDISVNHA